jgi:hypothetical protein
MAFSRTIGTDNPRVARVVSTIGAIVGFLLSFLCLLLLVEAYRGRL